MKGTNLSLRFDLCFLVMNALHQNTFTL